jgi:tRNA(Ile)-lysidine synthase
MKQDIPINAIFNKVCAFVDSHALLPVGSTVVVGLSGGPDSVFLLYFLISLQKKRALTLIAAHLNHEWRPESDEDASFCRALCMNLGIPLYETKLSKLSPMPPYEGSREAQGRAARRLFLTQVQQTVRADSIALAHHTDDQQETFFIRLMRGSSLTGLTGMAPRAGLFIRPLLCINKQAVKAYFAEEHDIFYCSDSSNESAAFLRNRIRKSVLPALKEADGRFDDSFAHTLARLQDTEHFLHLLTQQLFESCAQQQEGGYTVSLPAVQKAHPVLQERLLIYWLCKEGVPFPATYGFLQELLRFIMSPRGGKHILHPTWCISKQGKQLKIIDAKKLQ